MADDSTRIGWVRLLFASLVLAFWLFLGLFLSANEDTAVRDVGQWYWGGAPGLVLGAVVVLATYRGVQALRVAAVVVGLGFATVLSVAFAFELPEFLVSVLPLGGMLLLVKKRAHTAEQGRMDGDDR